MRPLGVMSEWWAWAAIRPNGDPPACLAQGSAAPLSAVQLILTRPYVQMTAASIKTTAPNGAARQEERERGREGERERGREGEAQRGSVSTTTAV